MADDHGECGRLKAMSSICAGASSSARRAAPVARASVVASGRARQASRARTTNDAISTKSRPSRPSSRVVPSAAPTSEPAAHEAWRPDWVQRMRPLVRVSGSLLVVSAYASAEGEHAVRLAMPPVHALQGKGQPVAEVT